MIELNGRKVWGTGYERDNEQYGDCDWKEKIQSLLDNQNYVIVQGRYGSGNRDYHYNIKGFPFSLLSKDEFLKKLDEMNVGFFDNIYLFDAFENYSSFWSKKVDITESNRYIFVSNTATECQMF